MAVTSLQAYALARAVDVLGGVEQLARRLSISQTRLKLYAKNVQPLPGPLFLQIVDVLVDGEVARLLKEQRRGNGHAANGETSGSSHGNTGN